MAIPFAKEYVQVKRSQSASTEADLEDIDGYDDIETAPVEPLILTAEDVRAVIELPTANPNLIGGDKIVYNATMLCDPCDIQQGDWVFAYDKQYTVLAVIHQHGLGLDHLTVTMRLVTGASAIQ